MSDNLRIDLTPEERAKYCVEAIEFRRDGGGMVIYEHWEDMDEIWRIPPRVWAVALTWLRA